MGYCLTYKFLPNDTKVQDRIEEIEEKIIGLEGKFIGKLQVEISQFFHMTYKNKAVLDPNKEFYEKCYFINECIDEVSKV